MTHSFTLFFWISSVIVHAVTLLAMFARRLQIRFPAVALQVFLSLAVDGFVMPIIFRTPYYRTAYICELLMLFGAELLVISEVTKEAFPEFQPYSRVGIALLALATVISLACVPAAGWSGGPYILQKTISTAIAIFEAALVTALCVYLLFTGRPWRHYGHGFIVGIGFSSTGAAVISAFESLLGWNAWADIAQTGIQFIGIVIWMMVVIVPEPAIEISGRNELNALKSAANQLSADLAKAAARSK